MKQRGRILFLCLLCFFLTGCFDKAEMEDRSYVVTMGLDKFTKDTPFMADDDNTVTLTLGRAKLGGGNNLEKEDAGAFIISGSTAPSAMEEANLYNDKQNYYGHLKTIILGSDMMHDPELLQATLKELEGDNEISMKTVILGCDGKAEDFLKAQYELEGSSPLYIWDYYKNTAKREVKEQVTDLESILISFREQESASIPAVSIGDNSIKLGDGTFFISQ